MGDERGKHCEPRRDHRVALPRKRESEQGRRRAAHAPRAIEYGVAASVLDDVLAGRRPDGRHEDQLVYDLCQTMHETHALPLPLYDAGVTAFGERGVAELMAVIGYYTLVSMTLNAFEVQVARGMVAPFQREP